ncbi:hypothetical protein BDQ17DRAFT_1046597 [Cyathus striatus]|nr:hypothetical protein BDQ17DRAFT_1046597 [Cyathus striatus]
MAHLLQYISFNPSSPTQRTTSSDGAKDGSLHSPVAAITGGVVSAILLLVAIASMILFCMRRKWKRMDATAHEDTFWPAPIRTSDITPFNAIELLSPEPSILTILQADSGCISTHGVRNGKVQPSADQGSNTKSYSFSSTTPGYSRKETLCRFANSRIFLAFNSEGHSQNIYNTTPLPGGKFVRRHLQTATNFWLRRQPSSI